jgi:hypothetical protein
MTTRSSGPSRTRCVSTTIASSSSLGSISSSPASPQPTLPVDRRASHAPLEPDETLDSSPLHGRQPSPTGCPSSISGRTAVLPAGGCVRSSVSRRRPMTSPPRWNNSMSPRTASLGERAWHVRSGFAGPVLPHLRRCRKFVRSRETAAPPAGGKPGRLSAATRARTACPSNQFTAAIHMPDRR